MTQAEAAPPYGKAGLYSQDNIFAKILRKEIPVIAVYDDEALLAFMDIMPQSDGHMLLIPKTACRNLLDADPQILPHCIKTVQKLAQAGQKALAADGIAIMQFNEAAAGQTIFHLHFHIIPHFNGVSRQTHGSAPAAAEKLAPLAAKIRAELARL